MFYQPISIREAVDEVNSNWFLPAIQRPYDWGERNKKEQFIYKLFDSIMREYPIGTLIIWKTNEAIPYRHFLEDYDSEMLSKIVDKGLWGKPNKHLVYDGQQRLQSLYSCLKFTFHNKVLCYNLLFDPNSDKRKHGFLFFPKQQDPDTGYIRLNEVYSCNRKEQAEFEDRILERLRKSKNDLTKDQELVARGNIKQLWRMFVDTDIKLLSFYPLHRDLDEVEVLDIFKRINTTGMELTSSEILFSEIKRVQFDFEEQIWDVNSKIKKQTGGFSFGPDNILTTVHLLVKQTVRIDPERIDRSELSKFISTWADLESPLKSFFFDFLFREFKITHEKIVPYKRPLMPIISFFYHSRLNGYKFKDFSEATISNMKKFFVLSQLLSWDLQGHVDNFHRIIKAECDKSKDCDFPFEKLKKFVENNGKRRYNLNPADFESGYSWFVLKVLMPDKQYSFLTDPDERFNPEIDHIFPISPDAPPPNYSEYYQWALSIWNMQPVKGEINGYKQNKMPKDFFTEYPIYLKDYNFLPCQSLNDRRWLPENAAVFIQARRDMMIRWFKQNYDIKLVLTQE